VLAFSATQNNDKVGVILFSDKVEKFIPPKKGRQHILRVIRELINFEPENTQTDVAVALQYLTNAIKKRSTAFVISDFIAPPFEEALKIASRRHDVVALRICDAHEAKMPALGLVQFRDAETGQTLWTDTSRAKVRNRYEQHWNGIQRKLDETFRRSGIDNTFIRTDEDYVKPLMKLFKQRG